jgi:hypothetical protein
MITFHCDECGKEMLPAETRQQRFKRGDVEVITRVHYMGRARESSQVCRACIVKAVVEPDVEKEMEAPVGMVEMGTEATGTEAQSSLTAGEVLDLGPDMSAVVPDEDDGTRPFGSCVPLPAKGSEVGAGVDERYDDVDVNW